MNSKRIGILRSFPPCSCRKPSSRGCGNLSACFADLLAVRQSIAEQEKLEAQLKQTLQQAMGNATRADFETGSVTWKKAKDSVVLDVTRLLKDQPDLPQRYALAKTGSRRFLVL